MQNVVRVENLCEFQLKQPFGVQISVDCELPGGSLDTELWCATLVWQTCFYTMASCYCNLWSVGVGTRLRTWKQPKAQWGLKTTKDTAHWNCWSQRTLCADRLAVRMYRAVHAGTMSPLLAPTGGHFETQHGLKPIFMGGTTRLNTSQHHQKRTRNHSRSDGYPAP